MIVLMKTTLKIIGGPHIKGIVFAFENVNEGGHELIVKLSWEKV